MKNSFLNFSDNFANKIIRSAFRVAEEEVKTGSEDFHNLLKMGEANVKSMTIVYLKAETGLK